MAEQGEAEYSVDFGEGDQRTMSAREVAKAYTSGAISGDTYVWTDGFSDWKPLSEVPELMEAVSAPASRGASKPSPWESRAGSAPRAAARSSRSATADLFGGIDSAGSEDDVATSAPDHHASSGSSGGSSTGARNESSVLFSLSALTSAANTRPSTRPSASTSRDDSGLIDLKALTAAAMKSDTGASAPIAPAVPAMAPLSPLGVAPPLGLASPLGGGITSTTDIGGYPQQPKSKAMLYVGGLVGVGMLAIAAALFLRPAPPPPPAPIVVAAPPTAAPAPAPVPSPVQQDAKPPATGAGEEAAPPTTGQAKTTAPATRTTRRPSQTTTSKKSGGEDAAPAPAPKAAPAKKSTGGCGCASGDLQCAMRCAARGG